MTMMTLQQAWHWIRASIPNARLIGDAQTRLTRIHTDTRTLQPGDFFVALQGERFDAHAFLGQAHAAGASAALACHGLQEAGWCGIEVPDTLAALGALAKGWRSQFDLPLIAVTGSNGKTTVTQMLASILTAQVQSQGQGQGEADDAALATRGNLNNAIGVPQTLLRLRSTHRLAVVELGMNHPGEIAYLADMVRPSVALVNNAQREHLEFMHTVQAVAEENASVFAALPPNGVAVFPAGDAFDALWQQRAAGRRCLRFGVSADSAAEVFCRTADWQGELGAWAVQFSTPAGSFTTALPIAGRHNVTNALAACACALAAGVSLEAIARGLQAFRPVNGRSRAWALFHQGRRITLVDDSYNANPDSVRAAIDVLADLPGPRLLVLGDMGEVGQQGPQFHAEAGEYARTCGIERLYTLGTLAAHSAHAYGSSAQPFENMAALQTALRQHLPSVGSVLVKGSRFMKMEHAVQAIQAAVSELPVQGGAVCS